MTDASTDTEPRCRLARDAVQAGLDEPLSDQEQAELARHLSGCEDCRAYDAELRAMRDALRAMPAFNLPDEVRKQVESGTVGRSRGIEWWSRGLAQRWRAGAAAALLAVVVGGAWWMSSSREAGPSEAEVAKAAEQLELVLSITGRALATVERATVDDVLKARVLPAVERTPLGRTTMTIDTGEAGASPENGRT